MRASKEKKWIHWQEYQLRDAEKCEFILRSPKGTYIEKMPERVVGEPA